MRATEREVQESQRIEDGLRRVPERFDECLDGSLGGLGAIGVTSHAVDDDKKGRVLRDRDRYTILIVGTTT